MKVQGTERKEEEEEEEERTGKKVENVGTGWGKGGRKEGKKYPSHLTLKFMRNYQGKGVIK